MNNEIVASAITSFNNSALLHPNFLWAALMMSPVFAAVWKIAPDLMDYFFPTRKNRDYNLAFLAEATLIVFLAVDNGNWQSIRDGVGFLPYLSAVVLFLLARDVMARLCEQNPKMPSWWRRFDRRTSKWLKVSLMLCAAAIAASSTVQAFNFIMLAIAGVFFGAAAGYFGRRSAPAANYLTIIMMILTIGIAMQPEYFRFGQMGRLTFLHLAMLAAVMMSGAMMFALRNFNPAGFVRDNHYRYMKWFMRLAVLLAFILFVMTESVPVLMGFGASVLAAAWLAVKHAPRGANASVLSGNMWAMTMCLFGLVAAMPIITIIGILCLRNNNCRSFWQSLADILK